MKQVSDSFVVYSGGLLIELFVEEVLFSFVRYIKRCFVRHIFVLRKIHLKRCTIIYYLIRIPTQELLGFIIKLHLCILILFLFFLVYPVIVRPRTYEIFGCLLI